MKTYLPIVSLLILTWMMSIHCRSIHRFQRSLYYANETGKDGELVEPVTQEHAKDVPVSTTFVPVSFASDIKEQPEDASPVKKDEESKEVALTEAPKTDDSNNESTHEEVTTAKQSDTIPVLTVLQPDAKKDEAQQDQPEKRHEADGEQKLDKESELITSVAVVDLPAQEKANTPAEDKPQTTKEPESSSIRQELDDSDKKLEVVGETKKEGRVGTHKPQPEITSAASVEDTSKLSEEQQKNSEDKPEQETQSPDNKDDHATHESERTTSASSAEEKQEPASKSLEIEKDSTTTIAPLDQKSSDESLPVTSLKEDKAEELTKPTLSSETSEGPVKSEESSVVSSTPQADIQEGREETYNVGKETEDELKKDTHLKKKEDDILPDKSDATHELEEKREQKDETKPAAVTSSSPVEQEKEEKQETTPLAKNGPSKRFADWLDYIPRDFQV